VTKLVWYLRLCDLVRSPRAGWGRAACTRTAACQISPQRPRPGTRSSYPTLRALWTTYRFPVRLSLADLNERRPILGLNVSTSSMPRPPTPSPPPASFPFTAGNFDYPHASGAPSFGSRSRVNGSISRALRSLADRPERASPPRAAGGARRSQPHRTSAQSARHDTMRRLFGPPRDSDPPDNLMRRPPTANPNRPRATPSERYLRRSSARIRGERAEMESAADLLDSLSDIPINSPFPSFANTGARPRSPTVEVGRQTKRRKLEHQSGAKSEYDGFKYGHKGQVVSGRLKMEILSCDGGEYFDKDHPIGLHNVRNVLKNDSSVYCSESSRCNLLLKHIGDAPFALEKIVIRAPDRGFTAPYVSCSSAIP
jgi:hypothetical protein